VPDYYAGHAIDFWFRLFDLRRLITGDTLEVIGELKKLKNTGYHDRPVSLYGGMADLLLIVYPDRPVTRRCVRGVRADDPTCRLPYPNPPSPHETHRHRLVRGARSKIWLAEVRDGHLDSGSPGRYRSNAPARHSRSPARCTKDSSR